MAAVALVGAEKTPPTTDPHHKLHHCVTVTVSAIDMHYKPLGVPLLIRVVGRDGAVIGRGNTDAGGLARIDVCWDEPESPEEIEARLELGADFIGSSCAFNANRTKYCLFIPDGQTDCMNWEGYPDKK